MKGLIKKLALNGILDENKLNNTSYTTIITSTLVLVNGIPVKQSPYRKEGKVEYVLQIDCLEYKLSGIEDKECDIQVKITGKENKSDDFTSLKDRSILDAYYSIKFLEANMSRFPQYGNVIRSYVNTFFGKLISDYAKYNAYDKEPYCNILVCGHFCVTYYYGLGLTFNSMHGDFVIGHLLYDMNPSGIAVLNYAYQYGERQPTPGIKYIQPGFKKYFESIYLNNRYVSQLTSDNIISMQKQFDRFKEVSPGHAYNFVINALYDSLDDVDATENVAKVFNQAVSFYNTNSI